MRRRHNRVGFGLVEGVAVLSALLTVSLTASSLHAQPLQANAPDNGSHQVARVIGVLSDAARTVRVPLVETGQTLDRGVPVWLGLLTEAERKRLRMAGQKFLVDKVATELWASQRGSRRWTDFAQDLVRGASREAGAESQLAPNGLSRGGSGFNGFPCYRTVEQTQGDLVTLAAGNPNLATWLDLGDTWEKEDGSGPGYDVGAIRITNPASGLVKAPFVIIAATHAREYTTAETATRFAEMLVAGYGTDPEITAILDTTEIHIVPVHNPDGRKKAELAATDFWRKNTNSVDGNCGDPSLVGIDLNRNSEWFFGDPGSSGSVCSEIFRGPAFSSEPETEAVDALMASVFTDQRGPSMSDAAPANTTGLFISIHSFGRYILYPWEALPSTPAPNGSDLRSFARRMGSFVPSYDVCQDCLGGAAGTNVEHAYGKYGVASYTYELGTQFHQGCSVFENTIFPEVSQALLFSAKGARRPYQEPKGPAVLNVSLDTSLVAAGIALTVTGTADDTQYSFGPFGDTTPEPQQSVAAVYYSIGAPPWTVGGLDALQAQDASFDELVEPFTGTIDTTGLAPGSHLVYFVAEDTTGQRGVTTTKFIRISGPDLLFADGFELGDASAWSGSR